MGPTYHEPVHFLGALLAPRKLATNQEPSPLIMILVVSFCDSSPNDFQNNQRAEGTSLSPPSCQNRTFTSTPSRANRH